MILLDTVTISETIKRSPSSQVTTWLAQQKSAELFLSVITIGEIDRGITQLTTCHAATARAGQLRAWLERLLALFQDRLLPFDLATARHWGQLTGDLGRNDIDLLLAATARRHNLAIATRNVTHFAPTGVKVIDPWAHSTSPQ